jgi:negative regulator of replication initiation
MDDLYSWGGNMAEYDNMAGAGGTHPSAWTKRAIQWLDPAAIAQHKGRTMEYTVHAVSLVQPPPSDRVSGVQIGTTVPYLMVEARKMADQFDGIIPKEGVIVYRVQTTDPFGTTQNHLAPLALLTLDATGSRSALAVGEALTTDTGVVVQVTAEVPGGYRVLIDDPSQSPLSGQLLSYGDAGTPGNVSNPALVGFGGWQVFSHVFGGRNLAGQDRIYAVDQSGQLLSYGDSGSLGNVSNPVVVGFGGWQQFTVLFAGRNLAGQDRIYAVDQGGQLLSYGDDANPGNVSSPVVVGFGGWKQFRSIFSGRNLAGQDRLYAVDQSGRLLSYGDDGNPGNVSDPVIVGFGGWQHFKFLFGGKNLAGDDRIYAVDNGGQLLSYGDDAHPGNVSSPVVVGFGGWKAFKFLFAGRNLPGEHRIYAVVA